MQFSIIGCYVLHPHPLPTILGVIGNLRPQSLQTCHLALWNHPADTSLRAAVPSSSPVTHYCLPPSQLLQLHKPPTGTEYLKWPGPGNGISVCICSPHSPRPVSSWLVLVWSSAALLSVSLPRSHRFLVQSDWLCGLEPVAASFWMASEGNGQNSPETLREKL